jgi:tetratricopeptide (TPR) repeat protein
VPKRILAGLSRLLRRRWRLLSVLALLGAAGAIAAPQLWAWYHFTAGRSALESYHADEARADLDVCLAVWPNSVECRLMASRAARLSGDFASAEQQLRECQRLQKTPSDDTVLEWALFHAAEGDLDNVEGFLQDYIRRNRGSAGPAREALAEGYLRMYRVLDALTLLQQWLDDQPNEVQALNLRGNLYWQISAMGKAADDYRRVVELDPRRREARERLGIGLLETGRYDEALKDLEQVRQWKPDDPDLEVQIARCHERIGRPQQAEEILDAVLAKHPEYGPALRLRGQMLLQAGRPADAENWLRQAVQALPDDYQANWSLYQSLEKQDKTAEAKDQLARAEYLKDRSMRLGEITTREMIMRPRDPALRCELGGLLLKKGLNELGERWLLSTLTLDPHYRPAHAALAEYYQEQGDADKADAHRREAQTGPSTPPLSPGP